MTEPAPEPQPFAWLPVERVLRWLQVDAGSEQADVVEDCRQAAADYCERQRGDLVVIEYDEVTGLPTSYVFMETESIVQAGVLAAARLYARRSSPAGLASYAEFGAAEVLRLDPDVARLLGVGRYAPPAVG
jgi:hypothetical protein